MASLVLNNAARSIDLALLKNTAGAAVAIKQDQGLTIEKSDGTQGQTLSATGSSELSITGDLKFSGGNANLNGHQLLSARLENLSTDPVVPTVGQVWFNTTSGLLKYKDNSGVQTFATSSSSFTGDLSTTQGFLNNTTASTPVIVRDSDGLAIQNSAGSQTATFTTTAANQLTLDSQLIIKRDTGLTIENTAGSNVGTITATGASSLTTTADLTIKNTSGLTLQSTGGTLGGSVITGALGEITVSAPNVLHLTSSEVRLDGAAALITMTGQGTIVTTGNGDLRLNPNGTGLLTTNSNLVVDSRNPWKDHVRAATTGNITLSGTQTIDTVAVIAGDRVLVKNQTTGSENGIYSVSVGPWSRSTDADTSAEVTPGMSVFVSEGTQGNKNFQLTNSSITLGTTALTFVNPDTAASFSGDLASTQGFLNNTTASTPVIVKDVDGFAIQNLSAQQVLLTTTAANQLTIDSNVIVKRDSGLTIKNTAATNSSSITATAGNSGNQLTFSGAVTITGAVAGTGLDVVLGDLHVDGGAIFTNDITVGNLGLVDRLIFTDAAGLLKSSPQIKFVSASNRLEAFKLSGTAAGANVLQITGDAGTSFSDGAGSPLEGMKIRTLSALTTDATVTELKVNGTSLTLNDNDTHTYTVYITARSDGGSTHAKKSAMWKFEVAANAIAGVASIIGSELKTVIANEEDGIWDATVTASSNTIKFNGTGAVGDNITWRAWVAETTINLA